MIRLPQICYNNIYCPVSSPRRNSSTVLLWTAFDESYLPGTLYFSSDSCDGCFYSRIYLYVFWSLWVHVLPFRAEMKIQQHKYFLAHVLMTCHTQARRGSRSEESVTSFVRKEMLNINTVALHSFPKQSPFPRRILAPFWLWLLLESLY